MEELNINNVYIKKEDVENFFKLVKKKTKKSALLIMCFVLTIDY